jgi:hypothetical protein
MLAEGGGPVVEELEGSPDVVADSWLSLPSFLSSFMLLSSIFSSFLTLELGVEEFVSLALLAAEEESAIAMVMSEGVD